MLIVLGGLPGAGKTTIARELARRLGAMHLRIDSIEQAIRESGIAAGPMNDAGYRVACRLALDNLGLGRTVIADAVSPWPVTRQAWRSVAGQSVVPIAEIEVACTDAAEHRRRVEERSADIPGHRLPTWQDVVARDYRPWDGEPLRLDTAGRSVAECVEECIRYIQRGRA